jgi:hypothetical protein
MAAGKVAVVVLKLKKLILILILVISDRLHESVRKTSLPHVVQNVKEMGNL